MLRGSIARNDHDHDCQIDSSPLGRRLLGPPPGDRQGARPLHAGSRHVELDRRTSRSRRSTVRDRGGEHLDRRGQARRPPALGRLLRCREATRSSRSPAAASSSTAATLRVIGDLTHPRRDPRGRARGRVRSARQGPVGQRARGVRGEGVVDRKEFGLTWNQALEAGGVLVGDKVEIGLDVEAVKAAALAAA